MSSVLEISFAVRDIVMYAQKTTAKYSIGLTLCTMSILYIVLSNTIISKIQNSGKKNRKEWGFHGFERKKQKLIY